MILHGDCYSSDWFAEWAVSGRRGIEGYLSWIGDPRFPSAQTLHDQYCSYAYWVEPGTSDDQLLGQILGPIPSWMSLGCAA